MVMVDGSGLCSVADCYCHCPLRLRLVLRLLMAMVHGVGLCSIAGCILLLHSPIAHGLAIAYGYGSIAIAYGLAVACGYCLFMV